jgi:acetylornithine deacetylase/succinyl-diaminopimelate desuccinylase-like protein
MTDADAVLARADRDLPLSLARLKELLRIPSVGTDPGFHAECRRAAEWLRNDLEAVGFVAQLRETTGQPVVLATHASPGLPSHAPHILFYGHYDVQPADPVALWESPPFEPEIRTGRDGREAIYARGACDDKGQLMTFLEASRAWLSVHGRLPFRLTVLLEGDEEGDSSHFDRFVAANKAELKADVALICDTELWNDRSPAITVMLRGCICEEVTITGPRIDLHSGYYGGAAVNPATVLARILGAMHKPDGRVAIPGFYDGVKPIPPAVRRQWAKLGFEADRFVGDVGLSKSAGEAGFGMLEQIWARPTAEINGIYGGYMGTGTKTVLPAKASAKLSFRLVNGQEPRKVRNAFRKFVRAKLPKDCRASFVSQGGDSTGISVPDDSRWIVAARRALKDEWGEDAAMVGTGGSIPVVESFRKYLKIDSVLAGFGRDSDNVHSPNENYAVRSFHKGIRSWIRMIAELKG